MRQQALRILRLAQSGRAHFSCAQSRAVSEARCRWSCTCAAARSLASPRRIPYPCAPFLQHPEPALDIYVGNLPYDATEEDLREHFAPHANVASVRIVTDRETGRARGFGFVTVNSVDEARDAIRTLDGQPMAGRALRINEAQDRRPAGSARSRESGDRY